MAPRSNEAPTGPRPHILILDDEPGARDALAFVLEREGMQTQVAETSNEALEFAQRHNFDVILSDIAHPGLDGLALLPVLKQRHPTVPVVIISARLDLNENAAQALALGAFACVPKPFRAEDLLAPIRAALEKTSNDAKKGTAEQSTKPVLRVAMCSFVSARIFDETIPVFLHGTLGSKWEVELTNCTWSNQLVHEARQKRFDLFILILMPGLYAWNGQADPPPRQDVEWGVHADAMAKVDVYEFMAALKKEFAAPIIAITNALRYASLPKLEESGAHAAFPLPFDYAELDSAIEGCLKGQLSRPDIKTN